MQLIINSLLAGDDRIDMLDCWGEAGVIDGRFVCRLFDGQKTYEADSLSRNVSVHLAWKKMADVQSNN
jgi:hypothetical protein